MHQQSRKVISETTLECAHHDAWKKVCFYEHIEIKPSLILRIVLPVPQKTSGRYEQVDDISRCCYSDGGFLTKRITEIVENKRIEFCIVEQSIRFHRTIKLLGGSIEIDDFGNDRCVVRMTTNYQSNLRPTGLFAWAIARVIKAMHSVVMKDMRVCLSKERGELDAIQLQV